MTDLFWPPDAETESSPYSTAPPGSAPVSSNPPSADVGRPRRNQSWKVPAAAAGAAALVFGGIGVGVGAELHDSGSNGGLQVAAPVSSSTLSSVPKSYAAIAAKVLPSVVNINVNAATGSDTGSGVVLRSDGYILTNNHVIASTVAGQGNVSVTFNDGSTATARIVGADQEDDLAVVKVTKSGLVPAVLGSAAAMHVGDPVLAVGSPLGLQGTVTAGIVSALNRPVTTTDQSQQNLFGNAPTVTPTVIDAIQTDAAVNPGNSGGALVNTAGQVIGINSAIASTGAGSGNIGVGFAIPIDQARNIAQQLISTGKASHPLLGVSLADATDSAGNQLARVQALSSDGPAAKAGLRTGDVIVAVDGQNTPGAEAVIAAVRTHQPGDKVRVTVIRNGARLTMTVTLANASDAQG
jgi:putative serine protease PepD